MGPRCPGVSTIEIAYAVKAITTESTNALMARVIIPEPNLWTEKKPFSIGVRWKCGTTARWCILNKLKLG